jgi:hypothetical protein
LPVAIYVAACDSADALARVGNFLYTAVLLQYVESGGDFARRHLCSRQDAWRWQSTNSSFSRINGIFKNMDRRGTEGGPSNPRNHPQFSCEAAKTHVQRAFPTGRLAYFEHCWNEGLNAREVGKNFEVRYSRPRLWRARDLAGVEQILWWCVFFVSTVSAS